MHDNLFLYNRNVYIYVEDVCNEDVMTGPCRQWQTRYYFNKNSQTCEPFTYGGCQGTGNRFENRAECESVCIIGQEPTSTAHKGMKIRIYSNCCEKNCLHLG